MANTNYGHIKAGKAGVMGLGTNQGIAANSLVAESGMFLKISSLFLAKAVQGDSIYGISRSDLTFSSTNQTVALAKVNFLPIEANDTWIIEVTGQTILFDADLITSNVVNMKVNGVAMTPITFGSSSTATVAAIAAQLITDFPTLIDTTTAGSGARTIKVVPIGSNASVVITSIVVTAGSSQAAATLTTNALVAGDQYNYFDITIGQFINYHSHSSSTGTFRCVDPLAKEFKIVNA